MWGFVNQEKAIDLLFAMRGDWGVLSSVWNDLVCIS